MRKAVLFLTVALLAAVPAFAADAPPAPAPAMTPSPQAAVFSDAQRAAIEDIIKEYVTNKNPQVLAQGLQNLQQREQQDADAKSKAAVASAKDRIFNDPRTPTGGNPKGNVTVVEFYDYQCGYCKMSEDAVEKLLKEDKNVKFVYKDFPILGPASVEAAKAALASVRQGKFQAFHDALMGKKDHMTSDTIYQVAKDVGLNVDKLKKDMGDAAIDDIIAANMKLAQEVGARGTPMFIVNDNIYPGAMQYDQMKQAVEDARAGKKS